MKEVHLVPSPDSYLPLSLNVSVGQRLSFSSSYTVPYLGQQNHGETLWLGYPIQPVKNKERTGRVRDQGIRRGIFKR